MAFRGCVQRLILLYIALPVESAFRFEDCSVGDSIVNLSFLNILPDPIDQKQNLNVTFRGDILQDIPSSTKLEIKYYLTRKIFGVHLDILIPCIRRKYGSCSLPICEYMERFRLQLCPFLTNGIACECPLRAGSYGGENVSIKMPDTSFIRKLLAKGKYRTEIRLKDTEAERNLACFKFYTELI